MAYTATASPWFYSGDELRKETYRAVDTQTWKAGEWAYLTSTGKVKPMARGTTRVLGIFADSQASSTSTSDVKVYHITSSSSQFAGYVCAAGTDTTAQLTHVGENFGMYVASNIGALNSSNDTGTVFKAVARLCDKESLKNASTTSPGILIFTVKNDSVLQ